MTWGSFIYEYNRGVSRGRLRHLKEIVNEPFQFSSNSKPHPLIQRIVCPIYLACSGAEAIHYGAGVVLDEPVMTSKGQTIDQNLQDDIFKTHIERQHGC